MSTPSTDPQKRSPYGRLAYARVFKPRANPKVANAKPKFSVDLIMDPKVPEEKAAIEACKEGIKAAAIAQWKKWPHPKLVDEDGKPHDPKRFALVNGNSYRDDEGNVKPEYKGKWVLKASSNEDSPPLTLDADGRTQIGGESGKLYSGCYGKVGVRFYGTENGGFGIFAALNAVMFKKHGEPLGGGGPSRAEDYFDEEEITEEDDLL